MFRVSPEKFEEKLLALDHEYAALGEAVESAIARDDDKAQALVEQITALTTRRTAYARILHDITMRISR